MRVLSEISLFFSTVGAFVAQALAGHSSPVCAVRIRTVQHIHTGVDFLASGREAIEPFRHGQSRKGGVLRPGTSGIQL